MADDSYYRASSTFSGWELRDPLGRRVGRVSRIFVDLSGHAVHVEVALGPFGTRTVLLPVDGVRVDREDRAPSSWARPADGLPPPNRDAKDYRTGAERTSQNPLQAKFGESPFHALR